jgi:hypothetical protein
MSDPGTVDPEEAYIAAISSCHMLTFLFLASDDGIEVLSYEGEAVGRMTKNERGQLWVSAVELSPRVVYAEGRRADPGARGRPASPGARGLLHRELGADGDKHSYLTTTEVHGYFST